MNRTEIRTAVFLDLDNLTSALQSAYGSRVPTPALVNDLLDGLDRRLRQDKRLTPVVAQAYTCIENGRNYGSVLSAGILDRGVGMRVVAAAGGNEGAALQITVDAMEMALTRPEINDFIIITGDRSYLPLVQFLTLQGTYVRVCSINPEGAGDLLIGAGRRTFIPVQEILGDLRRSRPSSAQAEAQTNGKNHDEIITDPGNSPAQTGTYSEVQNGPAYRTLEIIEEYFGQYEEVYLTPLLRKLSDEFAGSDLDPKGVISELEEAGAVWLEKRKGFPYDYTVLLINDDHPDVAQVREAYAEREQLNNLDEEGYVSEAEAEPADETYTRSEWDD